MKRQDEEIRFRNGMNVGSRPTIGMFSTPLLPYSASFAIYGNGALPDGWIGPTWAIAGGKAVNTPTLGVELVTNGDMGSATGWTLGANWSIGSGVATKTGGASNSVSQNVVASGKWYQVLWQLVTRTAGTFQAALGGGVSFQQFFTPASYGHAGISAGAFFGITGDAAGAGTVDNVSAKEITQSTMHAVRNTGQIAQDVYGTYDTISAGAPLGVLANVKSDFSAGLAAWIDGTNIKLYKWIGTTWTSLISTTNTPANSLLPEIKTQRSGANLLVDLLYNGAAVGTQQTVSDAQIVSNTYCGMFSSYSGNKIASFFVQAP